MLNQRGGKLASAATEQWRARVAAALEANGIEATIVTVSGKRIADVVRRAIGSDQREKRSEFDAVVVGGGDGSISAAASVLVGGDVPLGILALGTFNHFARDLGLPLELEAAARIIARGYSTQIDVGEVNGRVFVNNSSLGIYPHLVAERDRQRRYGVARWVSAALAFCRVLWRMPRPRVRITSAGWQTVRRTSCLFIGNNMYELDAFAIARRSRLDDGELCLYMVNRQGRIALLQLAVRAFLGCMQPNRDFALARLVSADISARRRQLRVSLDGESVVLRPPLHYRIRPRALRVIVPDPASP